MTLSEGPIVDAGDISGGAALIKSENEIRCLSEAPHAELVFSR